MNSKNVSTKRLEREGKTLGAQKAKEEEKKNADLDDVEDKKRVPKHELLKGHKDKFYENLK